MELSAVELAIASPSNELFAWHYGSTDVVEVLTFGA